jgi:transposase
MSQVIIGMDPHKRSATIEVMTSDETVVGGGRYATDAAGHRAMLPEVRRWPERTWAIEGRQGIGRHIASRLLAAGEQVVDVPPKLSARTRSLLPGMAARPTSPTRTRSRWPPPGCPACATWSMTSSWRCCGSWPAAAGHSAKITPG